MDYCFPHWDGDPGKEWTTLTNRYFDGTTDRTYIARRRYSKKLDGVEPFDTPGIKVYERSGGFYVNALFPFPGADNFDSLPRFDTLDAAKRYVAANRPEDY